MENGKIVVSSLMPGSRIFKKLHLQVSRFIFRGNRFHSTHLRRIRFISRKITIKDIRTINAFISEAALLFLERSDEALQRVLTTILILLEPLFRNYHESNALR